MIPVQGSNAMLKTLTTLQVNSVVALAKAARMQRDHFLGNVAEADLAETTAARGEHNPTAALGFEPVPPEAPQMIALREGLAALPFAACAELYALMRLGQGDLAMQTWDRGIADAERLGDDVVTSSLMEDPDLHHHLTKGLYRTARGS
jgi:hypothetical protein